MTSSVAYSVPNRSQQILKFLAGYGWLDAVRTPIPGDASFRRYERIRHRDHTAILMDAPPEKEDVRPFMNVAQYLVQNGFRAPRILAADPVHGLLLLEDLGDQLYSRVLATESSLQMPKTERNLYKLATQTLAQMFQLNRTQGTPVLPPYDKALLMREIELFTDWYLPAILGEKQALDLRDGYLAVWETVLSSLPALPPVVVLRDYHADNLLVLEDEMVGLLDFQDAVIGSPAYDMVSFLEDARRDVQPETVTECINLYLKETGLNPEIFHTAYALLGAQRNTKIIGIFTRLGKRDGKYRYQHYLPRVWGHLRRDLSHPVLAPLAQWIDAHIPAQWQNGTPPFPDRV